MTAASAVSGTVAPGFEDVHTAFERNGETGGAFHGGGLPGIEAPFRLDDPAELARDLDLRIGLPPDHELAAERAELRTGASFQLGALSVAEPDPRLELAYGSSRATPEVWNDPAMLALDVDERARTLLALHEALTAL